MLDPEARASAWCWPTPRRHRRSTTGATRWPEICCYISGTAPLWSAARQASRWCSATPDANCSSSWCSPSARAWYSRSRPPPTRGPAHARALVCRGPDRHDVPVSEVDPGTPHRIAPAHRLQRMSGRDPYEDHRAATPLELLFDLTFVVAFGVAASEFAHLLADEPRRRGPGRVRILGVRGVLGVDQLHLVRVGLRHRRLGVPRHHHAADGRRHHPRPGYPAGLRLDRRGRARRQPCLGRRIRRDANGHGVPVVTRRTARPGTALGLPDIRDRHHHRAVRLDRRDDPAHLRAGDAGALRGAGPRRISAARGSPRNSWAARLGTLITSPSATACS